MVNDSDELMLFSDDPQQLNDLNPTPAWNILIADDDTAIHSVTKLVLSDILFEGRPVNFLSTYSGKQTRELLSGDREIAILLLDVVMETPHSGLDIVRFIREEQRNHRTRIILRTGQPGEAPERAIITEYDINDYKEKADLTSQRLFSCVLSALRSYRDIITIEQTKRGLDQMLQAANRNFDSLDSLVVYTQAVLNQISALLQSDSSFIFLKYQSPKALLAGNSHLIVQGTAAFSEFLHQPIPRLSHERILAMAEPVLKNHSGHSSAHEYLGYFADSSGLESVLYAGSKLEFSQLDWQILDRFLRTITQSCANSKTTG